jgi:hypothetical protein
MTERDDYANRPADSPLLAHETYIKKSLDGFDLMLCSKCRKLAWVEPQVLQNITWIYALHHKVLFTDRLKGEIEMPCPGMWLHIWQTELHAWAAVALDDPDQEIQEYKWDANT